MENKITLFGFRKMAGYYQYNGTWWKVIRPITLTGSFMPMIYGTIIATELSSIDLGHFLLFLLIGFLVQAAVNMVNDYFDFLKGQEEGKWKQAAQTKIGLIPFLHHVPYLFLFLLSLISVMTLYLAIETSSMILIIGISGLALGYFYSAGRYALSTLGLGEVCAVFCLGFFPIMIAGYIQSGSITWQTILLASPFCFLIASMILTNNIRDIKKDSPIRKTVAIRLGHKKAYRLLVVLVLLAYSSVMALIIAKLLPVYTLLVMIAIPSAKQLLLYMHPETSCIYRKKGMAQAGLHHFVFSILLITGLLM